MSVNIEIDDKYVITSDTRNFILNEVKTYENGNNVGKTYLKPIGYFNSLAGLLERLVDRTLKQSTCQSIQELMELLKTTSENVELLIRGKVYG